MSVVDTWPDLVAAEDTVDGVARVWLAGAEELGLRMAAIEPGDVVVRLATGQEPAYRFRVTELHLDLVKGIVLDEGPHVAGTRVTVHRDCCAPVGPAEQDEGGGEGDG